MMTLEDSETEELLCRAGAGGRKALDRLLDRHRERLRQMVAVRTDRRLAARVDASAEAQAATYAETGQFTRAVKIARQAVALAERAGATGLTDGIRTRLDLYLAEKPLREPPP